MAATHHQVRRRPRGVERPAPVAPHRVRDGGQGESNRHVAGRLRQPRRKLRCLERAVTDRHALPPWCMCLLPITLGAAGAGWRAEFGERGGVGDRPPAPPVRQGGTGRHCRAKLRPDGRGGWVAVAPMMDCS